MIEHVLFIIVATRTPKARKDHADENPASYSSTGAKEVEKRKRGRPRKSSASISVDGKFFIIQLCQII